MLIIYRNICPPMPAYREPCSCPHQQVSGKVGAVGLVGNVMYGIKTIAEVSKTCGSLERKKGRGADPVNRLEKKSCDRAFAQYLPVKIIIGKQQAFTRKTITQVPCSSV